MPRRLPLILAALTALLPSARAAEPPLFRDFMGLCGHTVQFKPELYAPVCRWVRDYHPVTWDLDKQTATLPDWPFAKNRVSWEQVYGSWHKAGLHIDVCLMIDDMKDHWQDLSRDARAYGKSFAEHFGPGGRWPFVEWVEIGNEPGLHDDATYRKLFEAMATGIREGNPRLRILPCNTELKSDRYWKGVHCLEGLTHLYDAIQIHRYALAEGWPTWRRSHPEDAAVPWLDAIRQLLAWRDAHAPGKPVWVTEFGWDAATAQPDPKGEFARWQDVADDDQARWLVRSFLIFASMGIDKAFVYFFNDADEPKFHAASGLTRNFQPKPAWHAVAWLLRSLGDCRWHRTLTASPDTGWAMEFKPEKPDKPAVIVAWHPTCRDFTLRLPLQGRNVLDAERLPLAATAAARVTARREGDSLVVPAGIDPVLVHLAP